MSAVALVTGGSGYLGSQIIKDLKEKNYYVINVDIIEKETKFEDLFYKVDILDQEKLKSIFDENNIDILIHSAASLPLNKNENNYKKVNVIGTRNLVEIANNFDVSQFCYISSSSVLGIGSKKIITESQQNIPVDPYAISKSDAEMVIFNELKSCNALIIRPRTIIGKNRIGIFGILFEFISNNIPVFLIGSGKNVIEFIDLEELSDIIVSLIEKNFTGKFNIGNGERMNLNSLYRELILYAGSKSKVVHLPEKITISILKILDKLRLSPLAPWHYLSFSKSFMQEPSKAFSLVETYPKKSNLEILKESYDDYIKNSPKENMSTHQSLVDFKILKIFKIFKKR